MSNDLTTRREFGAKSGQQRHQLLLSDINQFLSFVERYPTEISINNHGAEEAIRAVFEALLQKCDFRMALEDFHKLLEDTSGELRADDTISWYHQLFPIISMLALILEGAIDLDYIEEFGGLETAIRTHLNHDTLEDTGVTREQFAQRLVDEIENYPEFSSQRQARERHNAEIVLNNVILMTKKAAVLGPDGHVLRDSQTYKIIRSPLFPNDRAYMHNMLTSIHASPIVWYFKLGDGTHNLWSLLGASGFDAQRRLKYCDQREDMFGARSGFTDRAAKKWTEMGEAIRRMDYLMGAVLYLNFGYLEFVDLAYSEERSKFNEGEEIYPLGFDRYLDVAMHWRLPRAFHPVHCWLDRVHYILHYHHDPDICRRTAAFLKFGVYPVLEPYKKHFPRIFPANDGQDTVLAV